MYPRKCDWCGAQIVVTTDDPEILVACSGCDAAGAEEQAVRLGLMAEAVTGD